MSIVLMWGNEPYGIQKRKGKVVSALSMPEMNLQVFEGKFDATVRNACLVFPFMEERRVVVLNIASLDDLDTKEFEGYLKAPASTTDLLILADNVDQRKKLFKTLRSLDMIYPCNKVDDTNLRKVLMYEISQRKAVIQEVAFAEFIKRCDYQNNDTIDLLGMISYIDSMVCVSKEITLDLVTRYVPKYEEPNVFGLTALIKKCDAQALYNELCLVDSSSEEQIKTLSLLLRDYRIAYKLKYFEKQELADKPQSIRTSFSDYSMSELLSCMEILTNTVSDIKGGQIASEYALKSACVKLINIEKGRAQKCV